MNKREIAEIKKINKFSSDGCTIGRMCVCYVDAEKNIILKDRDAFFSLLEDEIFKYWEILRKGLSGKLGKNLLSREIKREAEEPGGSQELLMKLRDSALKDDESLDKFYENVIANYDHSGNYMILLVYGAYDIPGKATDNTALYDASDEVYRYVQCCICPVDLSKSGISYNDKSRVFEASQRNWMVGDPDTGFLFPAFNDRSTDIHSILAYAKKEHNPQFCENVMGCSCLLDAGSQNSAFWGLIENIFNTSLNFEVVKSIRQCIRDTMESGEDSGEPVILTKERADVIVSTCGDDEQIKAFSDAWDCLVGEETLLANNLLEKDLKIKFPGGAGTVKIADEDQDITSIRIIEGRKCFVVELEDGVQVNGITVS